MVNETSEIAVTDEIVQENTEGVGRCEDEKRITMMMILVFGVGGDLLALAEFAQFGLLCLLDFLLFLFLFVLLSCFGVEGH